MDFLKEHLSEELYKQLDEALKDKGDVVKLANLASGEFVRKDKFDGEVSRAKAENNKLTEEIKTLQGDLEKAKSSTGDIEEIKADAAKAAEDSTKRLEEIQGEAASNELDYEIRLGVLGFGAKDEKSVIAHVDKTKISLSEGKLVGLDEQLAEIKKSNEYLFGEPKKIYQSTPPNPPPDDDNNAPNEWAAKLKIARESGNSQEAIKIKQAAAKEGVILA